MNAQTVGEVAIALIEADYPGEGREMFTSFAMLPWVERAERVVAALEGLPPTIVSPGWRLAPMEPEGDAK